MATSEKIADTTEPPRNDPRISRTSPDYCLKFRKRNGRYHLHEDDSKLRNSLLAAVGFFELANAGDFAANVWNSIPIPPYAIALMAVGGSFALFMVYFAYRDARLSWENLKGLRRERRYLRQALQNQQEEQQQQPQRQPTENMEDITRTVNALLDVNHREMGTEIIDRLAMDILMGFGSTLVGLGTFLAIDGANPSVFLASNLMSGYIGNVPLAIFGLVNAGWAIYVWLRARRHGLAYGAGQTPQVDSDSTVGKLLKARIDTVRVHSALNGITGLVAGAASLVTSTMWWGYVVLIPCIIISVVVNYLWRHGMGYERPLIVEKLPNFDQEFLMEELVYIASIRRVFLSSKKSSPELLSAVVPDSRSVSDVLDFIVRNDIFEAFCFRLLNDGELSATLFDLSVTPVAIYPHALCNIPEESLRGRVLALAQECIRDLGHAQLKYRERYLLEKLGCYMTTSGVVQTVKNTV